MQKTSFKKQLKLTVITDANENDYEGFTVEDFKEGTAKFNGLDIVDLKLSGDNNNILTFIVEGYFKDVTEATIKFAEKIENIDYEIEEVK